MGKALADAAKERGARVIFIYGSVSVPLPSGVEAVHVETTADMYREVMARTAEADIFIMSAAPGDYSVENYTPHKIKADSLLLRLKKNPDIAAAVGKVKGDRKLVVFAAETDDLIANAIGKLEAKNADLIVSNDVTTPGAGFETDTNIVTLIERGGAMTALEMMDKRALADVILDAVSS